LHGVAQLEGALFDGAVWHFASGKTIRVVYLLLSAQRFFIANEIRLRAAGDIGFRRLRGLMVLLLETAVGPTELTRAAIARSKRAHSPFSSSMTLSRFTQHLLATACTQSQPMFVLRLSGLLTKKKVVIQMSA
jgi:hypothetical protein